MRSQKIAGDLVLKSNLIFRWQSQLNFIQQFRYLLMLMGDQEDAPCFNNSGFRSSGLAYEDHFQALLKTIQVTNWKNHLTDSVKRYSLETYKLAQLAPKNIEKIYQKVALKYKNNQGLRMNWHQNQLRLYIWFLAASPGVFGISTNNYGPEQLRQLALPFYGIHQDLCEYQFKSIITTQIFRTWEVEQDSLLGEILKKHSLEGAWSNIAKQLFLLSDKKYFRTPQSCRERWQNHLDDRKVRGQWTIQQDLLLMRFILSDGKRWSVIAKKIGDTRTQHMVKNRFQTILRREFKSKKKPVRFSEQHQFCKDLVKKLSEKLIEQSGNSLAHPNNISCSPRLVPEQIQEDTLSNKSSKSKYPQTPSFVESLPLELPCTTPTYSDPSKPPCPWLLTFKQYEVCNDINPVNICNPSPKLKSSVFPATSQYELSCEWVQKCFFEKIQTQLQLEVPLFIDEMMFGNQEEEMGEYFFKESREHES